MNERDQRHLDAVIALYETRLKESVSLKWLESYCKRRMMTRYCASKNKHAMVDMNKLLSEAKKVAKKGMKNDGL